MPMFRRTKRQRDRTRTRIRVSAPPPTGDPDYDDLQLGLAHAAAMPTGDQTLAPSSVATTAARWRREDSDDFEVWMERLTYGYGVDLDAVPSRADRFWFNALPALAGLRLGYRAHPALSMMAGVAETHIDRAEPDQAAAFAEIKRRFNVN